MPLLGAESAAKLQRKMTVHTLAQVKKISTPCCAFVTSLNDLDYQWPAGFSRFVLEARDPNIRELDKEQIEKLEEVVGGRLRQIWARY